MVKALIFSLQWLPLLILLLLVAFFSIFYLKNKRISFKGLKLPPNPPKLPIIGNLHQWSNLPHQAVSELSLKYGSILQLQLGYVPALVVSSPEAAKEILKTNDLNTCTRPQSPGSRKISYNYLDISLSPYSDYWKNIRKLFMVELMTAKRSRSLWNAREEEVTRLIEFLSQNSRKTIDLDGKIFELNEGILSNLAFGKFSWRDQVGVKNFQGVFNEAMVALGGFAAQDFFPTWWGRSVDRFTGYSSRLEKLFHDLDSYFQMVIDKHRSSDHKVEDEDFVDVLIKLQKDSQNSVTLTDESIKALIMNTFLGGTETVSVTTLWTMAELMKNPKVMKKVQDEIRSHVGEKPMVEEDDIRNLNYLKMVVKESMRLHPVAPLLIPHEAIRHFRIGGYDVLPGTRILVNVWAIGRDPKIWESPDEFNPDRFDDKNIDFKGQNFEFLPFGSGRRICPGIAMGVGNVEFALANLLYCFDWKLPEGMKCEDMSMEEHGGGIAVDRKEPLRVVPIKYQGMKD